MAVSLATGLVPAGGVPAAPAAPVRTLAEVEREVDRLRHEAELSTERYNAAGEQLRGQRILLEAARDRVVQQRTAIATTRRLLGALGVEAYRRGALGTVAVALGEDPEFLLAHSGLVVSLADQKQGLLARLQLQESQLAAAADEAARRADRLQSLLTEQAAAKADVERRLAEAQALLATLREEQRRELERASRAADRAEVLDRLSRADEETPRPPRSGDERPRKRHHRSDRDGGGDGPAITCGGLGRVADARAAAALRFACAQLGEPYRWSAAGPSSWDCSGLTMRAWGSAGVSLPHSSRLQYGYGERVGRADLRPGDLVFFYSPVSHVGLYLGNGLMIHAPHTGDVVRIAPIYDGFVGGVHL